MEAGVLLQKWPMGNIRPGTLVESGFSLSRRTGNYCRLCIKRNIIINPMTVLPFFLVLSVSLHSLCPASEILDSNCLFSGYGPWFPTADISTTASKRWETRSALWNFFSLSLNVLCLWQEKYCLLILHNIPCCLLAFLPNIPTIYNNHVSHVDHYILLFL